MAVTFKLRTYITISNSEDKLEKATKKYTIKVKKSYHKQY